MRKPFQFVLTYETRIFRKKTTILAQEPLSHLFLNDPLVYNSKIAKIKLDRKLIEKKQSGRERERERRRKGCRDNFCLKKPFFLEFAVIIRIRQNNDNLRGRIIPLLPPPSPWMTSNLCGLNSLNFSTLIKNNFVFAFLTSSTLTMSKHRQKTLGNSSLPKFWKKRNKLRLTIKSSNIFFI